MKRLIAVLLVLVMVVASVATLASCDFANLFGNDEETTTPAPEGTQGTEAPDESDETTGTTVPDDEVAEGVFNAPTRPADAVLPTAKVGNYTYNSYAISLGSNWNPHSWETNGDQSILSYLSVGFVTMEAFDTEEGLYQWVGEMATAIKDVTADKQDLLTKYNVTLPEGKTAEEIESGYVFEFTLNPNAKWQDGTVINADSYVYSMQQLLNPQMKNYRANLYISGESAIAGGFNYYYSLDEGFYNGYTTKYASLADAMAAETVYINVWDFWGAKGYTDAEGNACPQWLPITDETVYGEAQDDAFSAALLLQYYGAYLEVGGGYESCVGIYVVNENMGASFDGVGLVKTGDYSFLYVCDTAIDFNYFLTSCTDTWLVHKNLYEAGMKEVEGMIITDYMTSLATSISYGPYMMTVFEDDKQVVYEKNPNWYGWEKDAQGNLVSYTQFTVDGQYLQQYLTSKIVIDVMTEEVAKQKFLKGELMSYSPTAAELSEYKLSERLQVVDETYTMSFFFHTNVDNLKALDESGKNMNSVVLSNDTFRQAMSIAIDRTDFVTATQAWTPAFSLMNHLYHYDIYNDPSSSYRKSEEAMQAIVNLYGVEYGEGKIYETLEDAHDSITGYNLTEAKALMAQACEELVAAGLYTKGQDIKIQIGWAKGPLTEDDTKQAQLIEKYLNARGRQIIGWDEILEGGLAPNATVMSWRGEEGGLAAAAAGHKVVMSPHAYCYIDAPQDAPYSQPESIGGYLPLEKVYSYDPAPEGMDKSISDYILGVQANLWAEFIVTDQHYETMLWPRAIAIAEIGWSNAERRIYSDFRQRAVKIVDRMLERGYSPFDLKNEIGNRPESLEAVEHLALGKSVSYLYPSFYYGPKYAAAGDATLTDGLRGTWTYADGRWQGFLGRGGVDVVIDMGNVTHIESISADFMQICGPGVFMPCLVEIFISEDGEEFTKIADIEHEVIIDELPSFKNFGWEGSAEARYIRYKAHRSKYTGFLFVDEIVVR